MPPAKYTRMTSQKMQRKVRYWTQSTFSDFFTSNSTIFLHSNLIYYRIYYIDFLLHTRNLFDRRKLGVSRQVGEEPPVVWKKEQISLPLESDEAVIEFLAKHDYDLNKAKFFLACLMSGGRGKCSTELIVYIRNISSSSYVCVCFMNDFC